MDNLDCCERTEEIHEFLYTNSNKIKAVKKKFEGANIFHIVNFIEDGKDYSYEIRGKFKKASINGKSIDPSKLRSLLDERFPIWHYSFKDLPFKSAMILSFFGYKRSKIEDGVKPEGYRTTTENILNHSTLDPEWIEFLYLRFQLYSMWIHNPNIQREIRERFPGPSAPRNRSDIPEWMY